jgi:hypothetical protein
VPYLARFGETLAAVVLTIADEPRRPGQIGVHQELRLALLHLLVEAREPGRLLRAGIVVSPNSGRSSPPSMAPPSGLA